MQNYNVFLDELQDRSQPSSTPAYQVALITSNRDGGAMGTRRYPTKEAFTAVLQRYFKFTDAAGPAFLFRSGPASDSDAPAVKR